jgi:hypothetical protein
MPEPTKGSDVRTIALRVSPDYHAQLTLVAQVDEITLVDLMQRALDKYMAERRSASDFQEKVQVALAEAEAQMARTRAMLLGTVSAEGTTGEASTDAPATGRGRRKDEASG